MEPRSVFRLSLLFYLVLLAVVLIAFVLLWVIGILSGAINGVDHFIQTLFGYQSFGFFWPEAFLGIALGGLVLAVFGALANMFFAVLYNRLSGKVGGITVLAEEDREPGVE